MRLRLVLAGLATGLALVAPVLAQSPQDRATARNAAEEADKKLAAKDYDGALDLFTKADALVPAPTLRLQIGRVQALKGKLVEAQQTLLDAARMPPQPNEPGSWAKAREQAAKEAADLKARVPAIEIIVEPKDKPSRVTVDGEAVNAASLGVPRATNPGQHTIRAEADGFQPAETTIVLKEGDRTQVVLRLATTGGAPPPLPPPGAGPAQPGKPAAPADGRPPPGEPAAEAGSGHYHDGFFLRVGLGVTFHSSTIESKVGTNSSSVDATGTGPALDFMIGGMVTKGLAVVGDLGGHALSDPTVKDATTGVSKTIKGSFTYARIGAAAVWYPVPTGGFHLFAGIGFGHAQFKATDDTLTQLEKDADSFNASGVALSAGAGYELWVGQKSSFGLLLRLDHASLSGTDSVTVGNVGNAPINVSIDRTFTMNVPSLLANYTYN